MGLEEINARLKKQLEMLDSNKESFTGEINGIEESTAGEVFGEKAKNPNREVVQLSIRVKETSDEFVETFTLPAGIGTWRNKKFKLAQFVNKYGGLPEPGMAVTVVLNDEGFYRVAV